MSTSDKYYVREGEVWLNQSKILESGKIGVDSLDPGLQSMRGENFSPALFPGRSDLLFNVGDNVVWVEVKTNWSDFDSSRRSKRLAREIRTGQNMADIVVVAYPVVPPAVYDTTDHPGRHENQLELLRLQSLGVLVVPWSTSFEYWDGIRNILASESNQRRAIAGTDYRKPRTALAGLPGVGAKTEAKLLEYYGNADHALRAYGTSDWTEALGDNQVHRIEQACRDQVGSRLPQPADGRRPLGGKVFEGQHQG